MAMRVVINPDLNFPEGEVEKLNVSAVPVGGVETGNKEWWFKIAGVIFTGANQRVVINPDTDFSIYTPYKPVISAASMSGTFLANWARWWFRTVQDIHGRRVVIDPDTDFDEYVVNTILASGESYSGAGIVGFSWWFETVLFPLLVAIQAGWPDVTIISKVASYDAAIIRWESSHDGDYRVEVGGTGKGTGVILGTAFGSQNVQGAVQGGVPIDTVLKGADLEAASPNEGEKRVNIYVTDIYSRTNPWEA